MRKVEADLPRGGGKRDEVGRKTELEDSEGVHAETDKGQEKADEVGQLSDDVEDHKETEGNEGLGEIFHTRNGAHDHEHDTDWGDPVNRFKIAPIRNP